MVALYAAIALSIALTLVLAWSASATARAASAATTGASSTTGASATATTTAAFAAALFAHAVSHLAACVFSGLRHHVTAWRFASAAPQGLATHGNRLGPLVRIGQKVSIVFARNILAGKCLNRRQKAFFVQAH